MALFTILLFALSIAARTERPNIIVLLADDVGYGDLGCYGATLAHTPHLDRLAREGRRFMDAHSPASMCTPTRRALLTGTYSWRQEPGATILSGTDPLCIAPGTATLASMLKAAGYATGAVGKWHLGLGGKGGAQWNDRIAPGPGALGFDDAFIMPATGDRVPCVYVENERIAGLDSADPIAVSYRAKVGTEPTGREHPELLNLKSRRGHDGTIVNGIARIGWMSGGTSARWVDEEMADTFANRARTFIEEHRNAPFFLYLATHGIHAPQAPHPRFHGAGQCGTRGEVLAELDDTVGQILATLDRLALAEKTLVIFTSDNGGVVEDGYATNVVPEHRCNGPLRGFKGTQWEGGHRVPFIARWPGRVPAGSECGDLVMHGDLFATFAALLGIALPDEAALDSLDARPALLGEPRAQPGRTTFISHGAGTNGPFGIRSGPWKLVQSAGGGIGRAKLAERPGRPPQLFHLTDDPSEAHDPATRHPEKVRELTEILATERAEGRTRPARKPSR